MTSMDYESNNNKPDERRDETAEENDDQYQPIDDTPPPTPCVETGEESPGIDEEGKDEEEAATAIKTTGPAPAQDEVGAGWSARRRRFVMFWIVLLGMGVVIAIMVVVIKFGFKQDDAGEKVMSTLETNTDDPDTNNSEVAVVPSSYSKQQVEAITGDASRDNFGWSVALSADASTFVIGTRAYWGAGYVKVFRTDDDGESTVQIGQTINGDEPGDYFGQSVDISADGKTIICGSEYGYARVFSLQHDNVLGIDNWKQIGYDVVDSSGGIVSISQDGATVATGFADLNWCAEGSSEADKVWWNSGPVYVYFLAENDWWKMGEGITTEWFDTPVTQGSEMSFSLSGGGETIAIRTPSNSSNPNNSSYVVPTNQVKVRRFDYEMSSWEQLGQSIILDGAHAVSLSHDGNTLAIGVPVYGSAGYVRVYSLASDENVDTDTWKQIGQDIFGPGIFDEFGDSFGWSISLSDDGKTLAVGAPHAGRESSGLVKVYRMNDSDSGWMQLGDGVSGEEAHDMLGHSVSLSGDGNKLVFGSIGFSDESGMAKVLVLD